MQYQQNKLLFWSEKKWDSHNEDSLDNIAFHRMAYFAVCLEIERKCISKVKSQNSFENNAFENKHTLEN